MLVFGTNVSVRQTRWSTVVPMSTIMDVTLLTVELDDNAVQRLRDRAAREGIELSALVRRQLSEINEIDPFEFVGSFESDVAARDADGFLREQGFGAS